MKPVENLRVACLILGLLAIPTLAGAQTVSDPLPVLSMSDEPAISGAGAEHQMVTVVDAPLPPARPVFETRRKPVNVVAVSSPANPVSAYPRARAVEPTRVAMARTFWLTVGNGF